MLDVFDKVLDVRYLIRKFVAKVIFVKCIKESSERALSVPHHRVSEEKEDVRVQVSDTSLDVLGRIQLTHPCALLDIVGNVADTPADASCCGFVVRTSAQNGVQHPEEKRNVFAALR